MIDVYVNYVVWVPAYLVERVMLTLLVVGLLGAKCEQQSAGVCFEVVSTCRSCFCMPASLLILHYQGIIVHHLKKKKNLYRIPHFACSLASPSWPMISSSLIIVAESRWWWGGVF